MSDLIRRSDAIKEMEKLIKAEGTMDYTEWDFPTSYKQERINQTEACIDQIRYIPVVKPKRGEWIEDGGIEKCNQCGERKEFPHWNFCPNCGADMREREGE